MVTHPLLASAASKADGFVFCFGVYCEAFEQHLGFFFCYVLLLDDGCALTRERQQITRHLANFITGQADCRLQGKFLRSNAKASFVQPSFTVTRRRSLLAENKFRRATLSSCSGKSALLAA